MKDKEDKDKMQLNVEVKELIRVINHDKKLKEFMKIKTQERQEDEELISWRKKKGTIEIVFFSVRPFLLRLNG
jgi:regulatory protein YycH of two-component signal transduction system YycFG